MSSTAGAARDWSPGSGSGVWVTEKASWLACPSVEVADPTTIVSVVLTGIDADDCGHPPLGGSHLRRSSCCRMSAPIRARVWPSTP